MTDIREIVWLRDIDGTGSMHPCAEGDEGAIAFVSLEAIESSGFAIVPVEPTEAMKEVGGDNVFAAEQAMMREVIARAAQDWFTIAPRERTKQRLARHIERAINEALQEAGVDA